MWGFQCPLTLCVDNDFGKKKKGKGREGREGKGREEKCNVTLVCLEPRGKGREGKGREMRVFPTNFFNFGDINNLTKIMFFPTL